MMMMTSFLDHFATYSYSYTVCTDEEVVIVRQDVEEVSESEEESEESSEEESTSEEE